MTSMNTITYRPADESKNGQNAQTFLQISCKNPPRAREQPQCRKSPGKKTYTSIVPAVSSLESSPVHFLTALRLRRLAS
jgi:hypothetical protein